MDDVPPGTGAGLPPPEPSPPPPPARGGPPLWQWLAVGLGGSLLTIAVARMGATSNDKVNEAQVATMVPNPSPRNDRTLPERGGTTERASIPRVDSTVRITPIGEPGSQVPDVDESGSGIVGKRLGSEGAKRPASLSSARGKNSFPSERAALDGARAELDKKDAVKALAILDQFDKEYPSPMYAPESRALRVEAHALRQDDARALAVADEFLQDFPHSPKADRVRAIREAIRARAKP